MTTQTPDAVREAIVKYTQHYVGCAVYGSWADGEPKCSCGLDEARASLAALDSRAGDAGEGLERLRPMLENATWSKYPSAPDVPENWSLSIDSNRKLASELLNMLPALLATPAPAVDAVPAGEVERLRQALARIAAYPSSSRITSDVHADRETLINIARASLSHGEGRK